jgi:hypothetical protein
MTDSATASVVAFNVVASGLPSDICNLIQRSDAPDRAVIATRAFKPYETLLHRQPPYTLAPNDDSIDSVCWYCFATCERDDELQAKLLRCSKCKQARYCGRSCQTRAWTYGGHRQECTILAANAHHGNTLTRTFRLALGALIQREREIRCLMQYADASTLDR